MYRYIVATALRPIARVSPNSTIRIECVALNTPVILINQQL